jgi:hypothetical protein
MSSEVDVFERGGTSTVSGPARFGQDTGTHRDGGRCLGPNGWHGKSVSGRVAYLGRWAVSLAWDPLVNFGQVS